MNGGDKYFGMERAQSRCIDSNGEYIKRIQFLEREKDELRDSLKRAENREALCEREKAKLEEQTFVTAFVIGAVWWEREKTGATMRGSDRLRAEQEADKARAVLQPERPSGEKGFAK